MTVLRPELEDLRARLHSLEARNRWLHRGGVFVLLLAGTGLLMGGQAPSPGHVLQAERFSLRDANGKERAWLGLDHGRPILRFLSTNGEESADVEMADEGLILHIRDSAGRLRTGLCLEQQGVAFFTFSRDGRLLVGEGAVMNHGGTMAPAAEQRAQGIKTGTAGSVSVSRRSFRIAN
jgi:hypothetical protein